MRPALLFCAALTLSARAISSQAPSEKAVAAVLDDWHLAAAQADESRYFGHMAENAVFMGTDATERWPKAAFQAWAHPIFQRGKAWSFKAVRRAIAFSKDGRTAWFDEDLDTPNLGPSRGSGVLTLEKERWRIQQYNLSVPIPNALMKAVKTQIEAQTKSNPR
ncbi:MAG: nuclear transport factor 2 family protein [Acidobacteria bacterium]|nr:nuclear transport factor 2 family protein [Acidobacteriota bacterium]MBI3488533.1 nuclear transport factor 2 family protein [Acidobacteriota bacterium]